MPKKNDVSRFLAAAADQPPVPPIDDVLPVETAAQKRARIVEAMQNAQATKGAIDAGTNGRDRATLSRIHQKMKRLSDDVGINDLMVGIGRMPAMNARDLLLPEDRALLAGRTSAAAGQMMQRQMLTEEFPTGHDDWIMEDLYDQRPPQRPQRQPQRQALREDAVPQRRQVREAPNLKAAINAEHWKVKQYLGETRGGSKVHVWKVENPRTGTKLDTLFRVEGVANRVALLLNETGDLNDPRVVGLVGAYNKRDKLLKEARALQKSADGKPMKSDRLRQIQAEINQLDYRLGI
jgi:hypothetical protein